MSHAVRPGPDDRLEGPRGLPANVSPSIIPKAPSKCRHIIEFPKQPNGKFITDDYLSLARVNKVFRSWRESGFCLMNEERRGEMGKTK